MKKQKKIKAWAVIYPEGHLAHGTVCTMEKDGEVFAAVFAQEEEGRKCIREHKVFYGDAKLYLVLISFPVPRKKKK